MLEKADESVKIYQVVIANKVFISQNNTAALPTKSFRCFSTQNTLKYYPFCDDFGPMNMASIIRFIELLDSEIASYPSHTIVYNVESGRRALSNAVFLLGAYMILKLDMNATHVANNFSWLNENMIENFRDATYSEIDFELTLLDCWRGLEKGRSLGWIRLPGKDSKQWGRIKVEIYEHYDNPDQADLHEVVPGKFVALRGPEDLGGKTYCDDKRGCRHFSPAHYVPIFEKLGVTCLIRLNEVHYDAQDFTGHGIDHHDLEFIDCTPPSKAVVEEFFKVVDSCPGAVAMHCKAGLGRTGTLIAIYLMRTHCFTAREAMGWLRIMRPGSVVGEQQHYLCDVERTLREMLNKEAPKRPMAPIRRALASCAALAAQVANGMDRRSAARGRAAVQSTALPAIGGIR